MTTTTLNSSVIREASYDTNRRMMVLTFQNGTTYTYNDVDEAIFRGLITANSAGQFFGRNISGRFATTRG